MAASAREASKTKKTKRCTHYKLTIKGLSEYLSRGEMKKGRHIRANYGYYGGKDVMSEEA